MTKYWMTIIGAGALLVSTQAFSAVIDFENAPSYGLSDNDAVTTQYNNPTYGNVTFNGGYLEQVGGSDGNPQGFLNNQKNEWDVENPLSAGVPGLGEWFLRTDGEVAGRGEGGDLGGSGGSAWGTNVFLQISYDEGVTAASGQIWDIDSAANQGPNGGVGTEAWVVHAYDQSGNEVAFDTSPEFDGSDGGSLHGSDTLDGLPWKFNLGVTGNDLIYSIEFEFTGTKQEGIGLAFDNFNATGHSLTDVPEPGTLSILALGLLCLTLAGFGRARRMD